MEHGFTLLFTSAHQEALHFIDVEGRPLGEGAVPNALANVPTDWKGCPYEGSRYQHSKPMNVSALRQVTASWRDILSLLGELRCESQPWDQMDVLNISSVWSLAITATSIPNYLVHRKNEPISPLRIPMLASVIYKTLSGVFQVIEHLAVFGISQGIHARSVLSPDVLAAHADDHQLFEGRVGVCAGPPAMISELLSLVVNGQVGGSQGKESLLSSLVGDRASFLDFSSSLTELQRAKQVLSLWLLILEAEMDEHGRTSPVSHASTFGDAVRSKLTDRNLRSATIDLATNLTLDLPILDPQKIATNMTRVHRLSDQGELCRASTSAFRALLEEFDPLFISCQRRMLTALGHMDATEFLTVADFARLAAPAGLEAFISSNHTTWEGAS